MTSRTVTVSFDVVDEAGNKTPGSCSVTVTDPSTTTFPNASTTGVPAGTTLTASGAISVSANNTVIDGLDVTGEIKVLNGVTGVVIKNTRVKVTGGVYAIDCEYAGSAGPVTIENMTIISDPSANTSACIHISAGSTVKGCDISGSAKSIIGSMTGTTIENNYMHDLVNVTGSTHCENIYVGTTNGGCLIQGNTMENPLPQTAAVFLDPAHSSGISGVTISGNLVAGGDYPVYGGGSLVTDVAVENNVFSRKFYPQSGSQGPIDSPPSGAGCVYSGNTWDDGSPLA